MTGLSPIVFKLQDVVIGWRAEALLFAQENGFPLVINSEERPYYYFYRENDTNQPWYEAIYDLGMRSLLPIPFEIQTISMEEEKLKIITKSNTKILIDFERLHLFDVENVMSLPIEQTIEEYVVYDYFNIRKGSEQEAYHLLFDDEVVKEAKFVRSRRSEKESHKDVIVTSYIPGDEKDNFDHSPSIIKIYLDRMLLERNIRASYGDKETSWTRKVLLEHDHRVYNKHKFSVKILDDLDERIKIYGNE